MAEWFHAKFARLGQISDAEAKKDALAEIKIKLGGLPHEELSNVARNVDLQQIFAQLTSTDRDVIEQLCDILSILMNILDAGEIHRRFPAGISLSISHQEAAVKTVALKELLRTASVPSKLSQLLNDTDLLIAVAERIGDDDLVVSKSAAAVVTKIGESSEGVRVLYSGQLLRTFARLIAKNEIVSFRVYNVVVDISRASKAGLEASENSGFLTSLIAVLSNEEILLQLNALETITGLALTEDGLDFLERKEVLSKLADKIAHANENPLATLLIPGLMKFFGNVAQCSPDEIFSKYPVVVSALFEVIDGGDVSLLPIALDTLGHIATRVEGKYALEHLGDAMPGALKKISDIIQKMPTQIRIRGLNNLAVILQVEKSQQDNRIVSLTKSWFDMLGEDPLGIILGFCKQPFADIRQAGLEVLAVVASQVWGQEYIANCPGLTEFLLDRNVESFKECKEVKYAVVKILSTDESNIFDPETVQRFKQFLAEGPMFVDTTLEVAIQEA